MVFCGLFPIDTDRYEDLRDALEKLALNDAALSYAAGDLRGARLRLPRPASSASCTWRSCASGWSASTGWSCWRRRPNVRYEVDFEKISGEAVGEDPHGPTELPDPGSIESIEEPYIRATIIIPSE